MTNNSTARKEDTETKRQFHTVDDSGQDREDAMDACTYIDIYMLRPSKLNHYETDSYKDFKEGIHTFGIQSPISVVGPYPDGTYEIIAGERRYLAAKELYEEGDEKFRFVPALIIGTSDMNDLEKELRIEMSNLEVRDDINLHEHRLNVIQIVKRMMDNKEDSEELSDRKKTVCFNNMVQHYLKITPRYRRYYVSIFDDGSDALKEMFKENKLPVKTASLISQQPEMEQDRIVKEIRKGESPKDVIRKYVAAETAEERAGTDKEALENRGPEDALQMDATIKRSPQIRDTYTQAFDVTGMDDKEERIIKGEYDDSPVSSGSNHIKKGSLAGLTFSGSMDDLYGQFAASRGSVDTSVDSSQRLKCMEADIREDDKAKKTNTLAAVRKWLEKIIQDESYLPEEEPLIELCKEIAQLF